MEKKVTTVALEAMRMGETRTFRLPSVQACRSGKSLAYQYQHLIGCRFMVQTDYHEHELTLTKLPI